MLGQSFVRPPVPVMPMPPRADALIEATIVADCNSIAADKAHLRIVELSAAQLLRRAELEIRTDDVDCAAQSDFSAT